jgi:hypothetical protein
MAHTQTRHVSVRICCHERNPSWKNSIASQMIRGNHSLYRCADARLNFAAAEPVEDTEEGDEDAAAEEPIPARAVRGRDRRGNVFVEAVELEDDWVPPTYPKSEEEMKRLEAYVGKTALLSYLDDKAKATVIGAFQKKSYAKDEAVITQV